MSLVLEALRRVEQQPGKEPGVVGAFVSSHRPGPGRFRLAPLALGLVAGGALMFLWPLPSSRSLPPQAAAPAAASTASARPKGRAALPPPIFESAPFAAGAAAAAAAPPRSAPVAAPAATPVPQTALVLQAISERDGRPVAMVNDRLVKEGDLIDGFRVVAIGSESVDIVRRDGRRETVHFAPPPPEASPTPLA